MPSPSSQNSFFNYIKENDIRSVDFRFTDLDGVWHHITKPIEDVNEGTIESGIGFDGSSIKHWKPVQDSDMVLKPDLDAFFPAPFSSHSKIAVICDVIDTQTKDGYEKDPRTIAKRTEEYFRSQNFGDSAYFGPEPEFFIFDKADYNSGPYSSHFSLGSSEISGSSPDADDEKPLGYKQSPKGGYFPLTPVDHLDDIRSEASSIMLEMGIDVTLHHHEVAVCQSEIGFKFSTLTNTADNVQKYKYAVKNVASAYGKSATFMSKPIMGDNGSGMHLHQSIWSNGKNIFSGDSDLGLSETALYYIGGIIKYGRAISAFANPTTNSYKRLVPGFEAPIFLAYSKRNRSASIRIPFVSSEKEVRIEARFPDPSANPYLTMSAMLHAGMEGIRQKIHPGEACNQNLYTLPPAELDQYPRVPASLEESLYELDQNRSFLTSSGVFTDSLIDSFISLKEEQIHAVNSCPSPLEFQLYYMC